MIILGDLRMRTEVRIYCTFVHLFSGNLLSACGEAGTLLGIWDTAVNKTNEIPALV